jgi:hypothetical protein
MRSPLLSADDIDELEKESEELWQQFLVTPTDSTQDKRTAAQEKRARRCERNLRNVARGGVKQDQR